jgi:mono/diheme cytochrome c family protein
MQRVFWRIAFAAMFVCFANLIFPSSLRAQNDAAKAFSANCVLCHSANGSGDSVSGKALKAKDLRSDEVQKKTDAELADFITKGQGQMPAFGPKLSADTIKSLVAYIRKLPKKK